MSSLAAHLDELKRHCRATSIGAEPELSLELITAIDLLVKAKKISHEQLSIIEALLSGSLPPEQLAIIDAMVEGAQIHNGWIYGTDCWSIPKPKPNPCPTCGGSGPACKGSGD